MNQDTWSDMNISLVVGPFSFHLIDLVGLDVVNLNPNLTRPMDSPSYVSFFLNPNQVKFVFILTAQMSTFH